MSTINGIEIGYIILNNQDYIIYSLNNLIKIQKLNSKDEPLNLGILATNKNIYHVNEDLLYIYTDKIYVYRINEFNQIDPINVYEYPYQLLDFKIENDILYTLGYSLEDHKLYYNKVNIKMPSLMQPLIFELSNEGSINSGKICVNYDSYVYLIFDLKGNLTYNGTSLYNSIRDGIIVQLNYYDNYINYFCSMNTAIIGQINNEFLINDCMIFDNTLIISFYFEGSRKINNYIYSREGNVILSYEDQNFLTSLFVSGKNVLLVYNDYYLYITGFNEGELYIIENGGDTCLLYDNSTLYKYIIQLDECLDYVDNSSNITKNVKYVELSNIEFPYIVYSLFSNDIGVISYIDLEEE